MYRMRFLAKLSLLAVVGAVSIGSTVVPHASAAGPFWFASDGDWTKLEGSQLNSDEYRFDGTLGFGGVFNCSFIEYVGSTSTTTSSTMTLIPKYSGCTVEPFGSATVSTNGCQFVFHAGTSTGTGFFDAEMTIACPEGKDITIVAKVGGITKCTIHVEPQNLGTGAEIGNEEFLGVKNIVVLLGFVNLKYTQTEGSGLGKCTTTSTTSNGFLNGGLRLLGFNTVNARTAIAVG